MKLYPDYKKLSNLIPFARAGFVLILLIVFFVFPAVFSRAQTVSDIQNKINQNNANIQNLEQEIASYQAQLDTLGQQKSSLNNSLKLLDLNRKKLNADIAVTQNKIDKTNLTIQNLSSDINIKESNIETNLASIKLEIKNTNETEQSSLVESILSQNDFSLVWNDIDNIATVREKLRADTVALKQTKGALEDTRASTIDAKNQLTKLKTQLSDQQKIVLQNTNEKNKLLAQTKNSEANYQKLVADGLAKKNALEKEISDYESQLKYILDPSSLPGGGVLSWPLDSILITNLFGKNSSGIYASGLHNGVDFRASVGTSVKALADGVVAGVGDTDIQCPAASFGRFVLIKYNNGLASTFGHLSLVKVREGDNVTRGQVVALSGYTGYVYPPGPAGAHLHVSVYARGAVELKSLPSKACPGRTLTQPIAAINAYLDPLFYLPATVRGMFKSTVIKPD
jgi:murein DD-endopeptidase MepM/ murein hydrolase activator NlpD